MYKDMVSILKEGESGNIALENFEITKWDVRAMIDEIPIGKYIRLYDKKTNEVIMSDTPYEKDTNFDFCINAHGNILIGGLGIGMILLAIQDKKEVDSILVLEKSNDVINLIAPQLPLNEKVKIIQADVFEWNLPENSLYNYIYMDVWNYISLDVFNKDMMILHEKYESLLDKEHDDNAFMDCWGEWEIKQRYEM